MEEYDGIICLPRGAETSDCLDVARATLAGLMAAVMTMACALVQPFELEAELRLVRYRGERPFKAYAQSS